MSAVDTFVDQFEKSNLSKIYVEFVSRTSANGIDKISRAKFESQLDSELNLIEAKVKAGSYRFSQFKEKLISKGANKFPRVISIPTFRDRITIRALCNLLRERFSDSIDAKLPQHTIETLQEKLDSGFFTAIVKIDVKEFYPNINHQVLQKILNEKIIEPELEHLIAGALSTPTVPFPDREKEAPLKGVPQGLAISNILAEIYLSKFDQWAKAYKNIDYFRYVDDILILVKGIQPNIVFEDFRKHLESFYYLSIHPIDSSGKSMICAVDEEFSFLGYAFCGGKAMVKQESILRLESSLAKILTTYKYKCDLVKPDWSLKTKIAHLDKSKKICLWRINLRITGCLFEKVRRGWMFYFSKIDVISLKQMHHLDKTLAVLVQRFGLEVKASELKSFVRTFHEAQRSNGQLKYIPNFDTTSIDEQRKILLLYGMDTAAKMSDSEVEKAFRYRIRRETVELEQDIQGIS